MSQTEMKRSPPDVQRLGDLAGDVHGCVLVAVAVLRRAFKDLEPGDMVESFERWDAHEFLTKRLWDPDCLWHELLEHVLVRSRVLTEIRERVGNCPPERP